MAPIPPAPCVPIRIIPQLPAEWLDNDMLIAELFRRFKHATIVTINEKGGTELRHTGSVFEAMGILQAGTAHIQMVRSMQMFPDTD